MDGVSGEGDGHGDDLVEDDGARIGFTEDFLGVVADRD
jgi:hypothetical protein